MPHRHPYDSWPAQERTDKGHKGCLFLGYNLRVILHRLCGEQTLTWNSWAVQLDPDSIESKFWQELQVDLVDAPLCEYVSRLRERAQELRRRKALCERPTVPI